MARPMVLLAEVESLEGISARKLVLETAKFNVINAYSEEELFGMLDKYPAADALVLHASLCDLDCDPIISRVKASFPRMKVIAIVPTGRSYEGADHNISSYEPEELLRLVRSLFGDPRKAAQTELDRK